MPAHRALRRRWTEDEFHVLGEAFFAPLDVKLEPGLVLQPDLLVVPTGELRRRSDVVLDLVSFFASVATAEDESAG